MKLKLLTLTLFLPMMTSAADWKMAKASLTTERGGDRYNGKRLERISQASTAKGELDKPERNLELCRDGPGRIKPLLRF